MILYDSQGFLRKVFNNNTDKKSIICFSFIFHFCAILYF